MIERYKILVYDDNKKHVGDVYYENEPTQADIMDAFEVVPGGVTAEVVKQYEYMPFA